MRIDPGRAVRGAVLVLWAAFFGWLLVSGEVNRYIGPRTYWVVIFGGISLGLAAVVCLTSIRSTRRSASSGSEILGSLVLLVPLIALLVVPSPSLGSLAASKKLGGGGITAGLIQPQALGPGDEVSFAEIEYASESSDYAANLGIVDGFPVTLTGFVTRPDGIGTDELVLTRFSIYCCAADVVPHSVTVDAAGLPDFADDQWLRVAGTLEDRAEGFVLVPEEAEPVEEPENPYIR